MTTPSSSDDRKEIVSSSSAAIVFANAQSGRGKTRLLLPEIEAVFRERGMTAEISETSTASDLESQVKQAIKNGANLLFGLGGDGTLQSLVNASYGHDVLLGVIPAGGGNDFARALKLPLEPLAALRAALSGEPLSVDLARVSTADGRARFYLGGGGVGLDAESAKIANTHYKNWRGRMRYVASAIRAFIAFKPLRVRVYFESSNDDVPWRNSVLASVLNTPTFGAGIELAPNAQINDGLLDCAFLEELTLGQLLSVLPGLAVSGSLNLPQLRRERVRKVRIETEAPAFFQGDGELIGHTPVEIEVVPGAVKFLVPNRRIG